MRLTRRAIGQPPPEELCGTQLIERLQGGAGLFKQRDILLFDGKGPKFRLDNALFVFQPDDSVAQLIDLRVQRLQFLCQF